MHNYSKLIDYANIKNVVFISLKERILNLDKGIDLIIKEKKETKFINLDYLSHSKTNI